MMLGPVRLLACLSAALALGACSNSEDTERFLIDPPKPAQRVQNLLGTAELRDVSLPEYASGQEVSWQTTDGAVRSNADQLWADNPQRAFTLTLAETISDVSGATVIAEPWPLASLPDKRVEVRVIKALAGADNIFRLEGRYYVSNEGFSGGNDLVRAFRIGVPLAGQGPLAIAAAQSQAVTQLAMQIATLSGPGTSVRATGRTAPIPPLTLEPLPPLEGEAGL